MNNYTEQQIEEKLRQLASIRPAEDTVHRTNQQIKAALGVSQKKSYPLVYSILSAAAMLLICLGLFYTQPSAIETSPQDHHPLAMTRIQLNHVFNTGGQQALNTYFENALSERDGQPETITLQHLLQEL